MVLRDIVLTHLYVCVKNTSKKILGSLIEFMLIFYIKLTDIKLSEIH